MEQNSRGPEARGHEIRRTREDMGRYGSTEGPAVGAGPRARLPAPPGLRADWGNARDAAPRQTRTRKMSTRTCRPHLQAPRVERGPRAERPVPRLGLGAPCWHPCEAAARRSSAPWRHGAAGGTAEQEDNGRQMQTGDSSRWAPIGGQGGVQPWKPKARPEAETAADRPQRQPHGSETGSRGGALGPFEGNEDGARGSGARGIRPSNCKRASWPALGGGGGGGASGSSGGGLARVGGAMCCACRLPLSGAGSEALVQQPAQGSAGGRWRPLPSIPARAVAMNVRGKRPAAKPRSPARGGSQLSAVLPPRAKNNACAADTGNTGFLGVIREEERPG